MINHSKGAFLSECDVYDLIIANNKTHFDRVNKFESELTLFDDFKRRLGILVVYWTIHGVIVNMVKTFFCTTNSLALINFKPHAWFPLEEQLN